MTTKSNFPPISDNQSNLILTHYDTVRDLKTVIANAKRVLQQYVLNESGVENAELASLNQILNEITLFLQHNESFTRFFAGKMGDSWSLCEEIKKDGQPAVTPHTTVRSSIDSSVAQSLLYHTRGGFLRFLVSSFSCIVVFPKSVHFQHAARRGVPYDVSPRRGLLSVRSHHFTSHRSGQHPEHMHRNQHHKGVHRPVPSLLHVVCDPRQEGTRCGMWVI